jgi:hypothetical protein
LNASVSTGELTEYEIVGKVTAFDRCPALSSPNNAIATGSVCICHDLNSSVFIIITIKRRAMSQIRN